MRHEIARDPVVGVVQEDFQYVPDFSDAGEEALECAVAYLAILQALTTAGDNLFQRWGIECSKLITGIDLLVEVGTVGWLRIGERITGTEEPASKVNRKTQGENPFMLCELLIRQILPGKSL